MLRLSVLDKKIAETAAERAKQAALLAKLDAPRYALERLEAQQAQLEAERARAAAEAAQLEAEHADLARDVALFDTLLKDKDAGLRFLSNLVRICESGRLGPPYQAARVHALALGAAEHAESLRARLVAIDKRMRELDQ